jgi:hypothetical protein
MREGTNINRKRGKTNACEIREKEHKLVEYGVGTNME